MASALEIDWSCKTVEAIEDGSVNDVPLGDVPTPVFDAITHFYCRTGQCPVKGCHRVLLSGERSRYETVKPVVGLVKVWICAACKLSSRRAQQVRADRETHRLSITCFNVIVLRGDLWHVRLMFVRCRPPHEPSACSPPAQALPEAAAAAPAALFDRQIIATIKMPMLMCTMLVFVPAGLLVSSFLMPPHRL